MNEIFLSNEVIIYLASELILMLLLTIAFGVTIGLLAKWDFGSYSESQFKLERRAYLVMTILLFVFSVKFILLVYFVFAIDALSLLVPGAMCAAGVISANDYGMLLLFLKLTILFMLMLWMSFNAHDLRAKNYPVFHLKSWLFLIIFASVFLEMGLNIAYFNNIDTTQPVSCCSTLYGQLEGANPLPFGLNITALLSLFYVLYFGIIGAMLTRQRIASLFLLSLFAVIAYYSVVYFFGTYIYELPTHNCPFCMLQKEYHYVGYLLWGSLFGGIFSGLTSVVMELNLLVDRKKDRHLSLILLSFFVLLCTVYVGIYYAKNSVFL